MHRLSLDCKATVNIGDYSRGGQTRGDPRASDPDLGCKEKYIPCGIVNPDSGQLSLYFGSSAKTSDFIVDTLAAWWSQLSCQQQAETGRLQLKVDNGPESSGVRTQFLKRMVEFCDQIGKPIRLLYYPPYQGISLSKTPMQSIEKRLERNLELPKWDILIQPTMGKFITGNPLSLLMAQPRSLNSL